MVQDAEAAPRRIVGEPRGDRSLNASQHFPASPNREQFRDEACIPIDELNIE
jgi:hypothetical protein